MSESSIPVLDAYRTGFNAVVWCEHERRWHYHGCCIGNCATKTLRGPCKCPIGSADGHRVAHCACPHSPYEETGYILREIGPFTKEIRARHGRQAAGGYPCPCSRQAKASR